uniref:Centrosomal protein of n=1 Tax=Schistocephalus solidus TaxID=70667 RepID=A0A0X3PR66_SCHSO
MLATENSKEKWAAGFSETYLQLCSQLGLCPLQAVTAQLTKRTLDLNVDNIALNEWEPILKAVSADKFLCHIAFRSLLAFDPAMNEGVKRKRKSIFHSSNICSLICKAVKPCIQISKELVCLEIQGIPLSMKDLMTICQGISKSCCLQHVSFEGCPIGDQGLAEICHILPGVPTISTLNLIHCSISVKGIPHLVKLIFRQALHRQTAAWQESLRYRIPNLDGLGGLRRLTLNDNPDISDTGAIQLADALRDDLWIKAVDLQNCGVSTVGALAWLGILSQATNETTTGCSITIAEGGNRSLMVVDLRRNGQIARDLLRVLTERVLLNSQGKQTQYTWLKRNTKDAQRIGGTTDWPGVAGVQRQKIGYCSTSPSRIKRVNCHNFHYKPRPIKKMRPIVRPSFRPAGGKYTSHYNKPSYQCLVKRSLKPKDYVKAEKRKNKVVGRENFVHSEGSIRLTDLELNLNNGDVFGIPWRTAARASRTREQKMGAVHLPRKTTDKVPEKFQASTLRLAKPPPQSSAAKSRSEYLLSSFSLKSREARHDIRLQKGKPTDLERGICGSCDGCERCRPTNRESQGDSSIWFTTTIDGGVDGCGESSRFCSGGTVAGPTLPSTGPLVYPARKSSVRMRDPLKPSARRQQSFPGRETVKHLLNNHKESTESQLRYQLKKHMILGHEPGGLSANTGLPRDIYTRLDSALSQVEILLRQLRDQNKNSFLSKNDEQQLRILQATLRKLTAPFIETKTKAPSATNTRSAVTPRTRWLGSAGVQFSNHCPKYSRHTSCPDGLNSDHEQNSEHSNQQRSSTCATHVSQNSRHSAKIAIPQASMHPASVRRTGPNCNSSTRITRAHGYFDVPGLNQSYEECSTQHFSPRTRAATPGGELTIQCYKSSRRRQAITNPYTFSTLLSDSDPRPWNTIKSVFETSVHPANSPSTKCQRLPAPPYSAPKQPSQRRLLSPEADLTATYDLVSNDAITKAVTTSGITADESRKYEEGTLDEGDVFEDLLPLDTWNCEDDPLQASR